MGSGQQKNEREGFFQTMNESCFFDPEGEHCGAEGDVIHVRTV